MVNSVQHLEHCQACSYSVDLEIAVAVDRSPADTKNRGWVAATQGTSTVVLSHQGLASYMHLKAV